MQSHNAPIDPRLETEIRNAGESGDVEAMVIVSGTHDPRADERGLGGQIVDRLIHCLHEQPKKVRYMPKLDTLYILGSGRLVRELLKQSEVVSASAVSTRD
jgi:hypothetical protein